jgi:hypothetical protein
MVDSRFRLGRVGPVLIFFAILISCVARVASAYSADQVQTRIQGAEDSVDSAFLAVLDAEKVGADVSPMLGELNSAEGLLARSEVLLSQGDLDGAARAATSSSWLAEDVRAQASSLKASTLAYRDYAFRLSLLGCGSGIGLFLLLMFALWQRFREHYVRRVMEMRPVVVTEVEA